MSSVPVPVGKASGGSLERVFTDISGKARRSGTVKLERRFLFVLARSRDRAKAGITATASFIKEQKIRFGSVLTTRRGARPASNTFAYNIPAAYSSVRQDGGGREYIHPTTQVDEPATSANETAANETAAEESTSDDDEKIPFPPYVEPDPSTYASY